MNKILFWLLQSMVSWTCAQQILVTGSVQDDNAQQIPNVLVQVANADEGTIADANGIFKINVNLGETLVFSSLGYITKQLKVEQAQMTVVLNSDYQELSEIVVTALGLERSTRSLGYNVQRIDARELSNAPAINLLDNLAGKLSGVTVTQGATGVGSTSKIVIRGESSFTNNNPLFVVDGMPINNNSVVNFTNDAAAGFQEVDFGNGAMDLHTEDIESISVLKGASAAALYGSRAANGVVIINTKSGENDHGIGVTISSSLTFEQAFKLPKFQNQYGQGNSGKFEFVDGLGAGLNDNISYSWGPLLDQGINVPQFDSPVRLADGTIVRGGDVAVHGGELIPATPFKSYGDNLKNFYHTGITTNNYASIDSKFEKGQFRLSISDMKSESIIPGVNLERQNLGSKFIFRPTTKLKIQSSINYVNTSSDNRPSGGYGSENVNYSLVAWGPRSLNIEAMKDYWQPGLEDLQQYSFNYTFFDNPYFILRENRNSFERNRLFGNIFAKYFITDQLSFSLRTGLDYSIEERQFRRAFSTNRFRNGGFAVHNVGYEERNTDFLVNYNIENESFTFDLAVGGNQFNQSSSTIQNQAVALAQPGIFNLSNAAVPIEVFEFQSKKRINSFYGIAKINFRNFVFTEIAARNDWSSALATPSSSEHVSFFYPSISNAIILSNILDLPRYLNFLKLRASWAQVGNDTNPYQTVGVFNAQTPYLGSPTFSAQSTIANPKLSPELTSSWEFGGLIGLFNNRMTLDFSYYNALTQDQIISLPITVASGYDEQVVNGGEVRSQGVELIMNYHIISNKPFSWFASLNFSRNITTVEGLPEGIDRLTLAYSRIYDNVNQTVFYQVNEGGRIGDMYGTGYLKNGNGDFIISDDGLYIPDNSLQKLGNYNPNFMLGFSQSFSYKSLNVNFVFDWRQGGILISRTLALAGVAGQLEETSDRPEAGIVAQGVINVGTDENPQYEPNSIAVSPEAYYRNLYDRNHEQNNTYNASYLKLRSFSLGYDVGEKLNWEHSFVVSLIGRNLFAISEIPHFDPEQLAVQGQQFVNGVEDMSYASSRSLGLKVDFKF
jgi:TonB-linked SusC/RagA family outer membrane protein